ncbi:DUF1129 domain-containing protein [Enterococcus faecalis]
MEPETLRTFVSENRELEQKLTKRNEQYIFDLKKSLQAANLSEEEQTIALHDILPQLVQGQKTGKTARQLFGTVSERAEAILNKPEEAPEPTGVMMWVDNTLFLLGLLTLMMALMSLFSKNSAQPLGLMSYILGAMAGGYVFYLLHKHVYQYDRQDKSKRPSWLKSSAILIFGMLFWLAAFGGAAFLPAVINPVLDPIVTLIIGALAFVVRYFFKKKFNISGSFMGR